jgi:hypothetical protein
MKTVQSLSRLLVATLSGAVLFSPVVAQAEPRFGVCRQQIVDYVEKRLGLTVQRIDVQSYSERTPAISLFDPGSALVYVKECEGFHAFEIRGTEDLCEHIPHYGTSSGSYIRYEGAYEGCATR